MEETHVKPILNDIVNLLENLAVNVDALESALIHNHLLKIGEIGQFAPLHEGIVQQRLAAIRAAISNLSEYPL